MEVLAASGSGVTCVVCDDVMLVLGHVIESEESRSAIVRGHEIAMKNIW